MPLRQWEEIQKLLWVIQEIKILKVYFHKYLMAVICRKYTFLMPG